MKITHLFTVLSIGLILSLASCKSDGVEKEEVKELTSGLLIENMDTLVNPGNDFMAYVNGNWIKNNEIPSDKSSYGAVYMIYEESQDNVKKIIEEASEGSFPEGSDEQKVGDLYSSYMDMEKRNELGISPLQEDFAKIDQISSYEDLATYFAYAKKVGFKAPLRVSIVQDYKNPEVIAVFIRQSGLGLPDREYYLKQDERSKEIRTKYVEHIKNMFDLAGLEDSENEAKIVMDLETKLAEKQMEKEKTRDYVANYNMFPVDTLSNIMPNFSWDAFLGEAGLSDLENLGFMMLDYTKALDPIITSTSLDAWKTYLKWGALNATGYRLNEAIDNEKFAFFSKELRGTPEQQPLWRRGVAAVNQTLGEVVGKVYVKKHFPPEAKERMDTLVGNLLQAYDESIRELDWMSDETKKQALDKLDKFRTKIGYPDEWKEYDVVIKSDDYFGNMKRAQIMEYNRDLGKLGKPVDKGEWFLNPQTVNAYYNPSLNEIVFPAAILQPPFFNMDADDAVNYGAIGHVIGHEIGHGFDNRGSTFDGDGALRNWWTDEDREEFENRTEKLVEQYNAFEVLPGLNVNGEFTLGENIGDLGGLSIAMKAYKKSLNGKEAPVMDGFSGEQRVFIGYSQAYLIKVRDEAIRVQVNTDPHSPNYFRVNGVVRNVPEFYTAFNVQEGDSLYLPPEERVKIW
jgi:putative endopeptidase